MILKPFFSFSACAHEYVNMNVPVHMCVREYVCACLVGTTALRAINDKIKRKMTERSNKRVNGRKLPLYEKKTTRQVEKNVYRASQTTGTKH